MITPRIALEIISLASIVVPITQAVKKWLKIDGIKAMIVSGVLTIAICLWRVLAFQPVDWSLFIILVVGVFLEANGIYHFGAYAVGKMVTKTS
ncbi:MAG: hypothetical protein DRP54_08340 [Spirochaetes bacterium]|nr:MAG: hypothetical protein DRP54_08340 [Spirochaetota bacterium]